MKKEKNSINSNIPNWALTFYYELQPTEGATYLHVTKKEAVSELKQSYKDWLETDDREEREAVISSSINSDGTHASIVIGYDSDDGSEPIITDKVVMMIYPIYQ